MQDAQKIAFREKAHHYPCPGCGADLVFEPQNGMLACPYCGRTEPLPESAGEVQERSYEEYLHPREGQLKPMADNALEVRCQSCGASVTFQPPQVAGDCSFCGSKIVAQPKSADPLVAPEGVLPFQIGQRQANEAVKKWLSTRWFAPNALKRMAYQEAIDGIYIPYWTYDAHTTSHYTGQRGEYYYVAETYTERDSQGNNVTRTRQVRRTRWHQTSGTVLLWHDDVLVAATRSISRPRLAALEPWDLGQIKPYEPAFLSGFKAQRYEIDLKEGFEESRQIMAAVINEAIRRDIGGDEQMIESVSTSYAGISFKHLLLPVFLGAYRFNQKIYQVMVNAQTGEVQGDRPYSIWKITFFVLFIILVIAIIAYFGNNG